jgi:hypothetical protein
MLSRLPAQNTKNILLPLGNRQQMDYKRGRPTQVEASRQDILVKESDHWLNPTPTHNRYSAPLEDESEDQQQPHRSLLQST